MGKEEYFVYVLFSNTFGKYYIGMTSDLDRRLSQHNSNQVKSTKAFSPWSIVHRESFKTRLEARRREKYLKSAAGRRWRKINIGM
jgi:putative endonuclease